MKVLIIVCALSVSLVMVQGACPAGFTYWADNGYCYRYISSPAVFPAADSYCASLALGCKLASIHSLPEEGFVNKIAQTTGNYWIGLNDVLEENSWVWTDGSAAVWKHWDCSQPNGGTASNCVAGNYGSSDRWRDTTCEASLPYVCKVKAM
uniref:Alpha-N-acetylgalactosamine-specific lectin-like n=1 Tax=Saccoglossus kowalevskii TaxID=10224 RepID=A0ABM0MUN2_SACKO|nr:PREDICTED: alpha-N-acetylgalactosamine-specific lectin-like [Saccoglossus kowalevskii]